MEEEEDGTAQILARRLFQETSPEKRASPASDEKMAQHDTAEEAQAEAKKSSEMVQQDFASADEMEEDEEYSFSVVMQGVGR